MPDVQLRRWLATVWSYGTTLQALQWCMTACTVLCKHASDPLISFLSYQLDSDVGPSPGRLVRDAKHALAQDRSQHDLQQGIKQRQEGV